MEEKIQYYKKLEGILSNWISNAFNYATNIFLKKGLVFDLYGLLLYIPEKEFNNAALCLSDQNPTITKFAVFQGLAVSTFFR